MKLLRTVLTDTREQLPLLEPGRRYREADDFSVERATLHTGDYTLRGLEHLVLVERKSLADLVACVGRHRERFESELERLQAETRHPFLLIEADVGVVASQDYLGRVHPASVIGSVLAWAMDYGVVPWWGGSRSQCRRALLRLFSLVERRVDCEQQVRTA